MRLFRLARLLLALAVTLLAPAPPSPVVLRSVPPAVSISSRDTNAARTQRTWPTLPVAGPTHLWQLDAIHYPHVLGGRTVTIAIVDSGAECRHSYFAGRVAPGVDLAPDDPGGSCSDQLGHGTNTAGDALEVCPQCRVLAIKVFGASGMASNETVAAGIVAAVQAHADVISLSLGGQSMTPDLAEARAISYAHSAGIVVLAASGNDGTRGTAPETYPAALADVRVAATDQRGRHAAFSNSAPSVALACPGVDVPGPYPHTQTAIEDDYRTLGMPGLLRGWASLSGTSMATPLCAGAVGLLLSQGVSAPHAIQALEQTASTARRRGEALGYGLINLTRAYDLAGMRGWLHEADVVAHVTAEPAPVWTVTPSQPCYEDYCHEHSRALRPS